MMREAQWDAFEKGDATILAAKVMLSLVDPTFERPLGSAMLSGKDQDQIIALATYLRLRDSTVAR